MQMDHPYLFLGDGNPPPPLTWVQVAQANPQGPWQYDQIVPIADNNLDGEEQAQPLTWVQVAETNPQTPWQYDQIAEPVDNTAQDAAQEITQAPISITWEMIAQAEPQTPWQYGQMLEINLQPVAHYNFVPNLQANIVAEQDPNPVP